MAPVGQLTRHVEHDFVGRAEAEWRRLADVELQDLHAGGLHAGGLVHHRAAHVVQDVVQLAGFHELTHGGSFRGWGVGGLGCGRSGRCGFAACGLRGAGSRGAREPCGVDVQHARERGQGCGARCGFSAQILAYLGFPEFLTLFCRDAHQVDLLEAPGIHGFAQTCAECLLVHGLLFCRSSCVQSSKYRSE